MSETTNSRVKLVIFKCIVEGDLPKFTGTSNISPSGGGARDLRFSPAEEFFPAFQKMFVKGDDGRLHGHFLWANHTPTTAIIHPPTNSRPNEVRIGQINKFFPAEVFPKDSMDCILLIVLDNTGGVYPYFTSLASLERDEWHPAVKNTIIKSVNEPRVNNSTAMGYIDFENGRIYTNGRS